MRGLWVIVAVMALAGLGWLAFGATDEEQAPPMVIPQQEAPAAIPVDPLAVDRSPVPTVPRTMEEPPTPPSSGAAEKTESAPDNALAPGMGRIRLRVHDTVTNLPVPSFALVFSNTAGRRKVEARQGDEATLELPLDEVGELLIEAEGYTPQSRQGFSIAPEYPEVPLTVFLNPKAPFSGIEILAVDDRGLPVPYLQVTALRPDNPTGSPLWVRRSADEGGKYQLPDLEPAAYRLHLAAIDENGQRRPLLGHEETVTFHGSERIALSIQFPSGSLLTVTVTDPATGALRGTEVSVRMIDPLGKARSVLWRSQVDSKWIERRDGLPAQAAATLSEPLPPGNYQLSLELETGERQTIPVPLLAGEHREMAITF